MIVDCAVYEGGKRREGHVDLEHAYSACHKDGSFAWIGLVEPSAEEFESLAREFLLHPLAVEDAIDAHQRPKIEVFDNMVLLVLKTARYADPTEIIELGEILVFLGEDFVISVRHGLASDLHGVRERLEANPAMLKAGPGAVVHAIVDKVVDDYQPALDGSGRTSRSWRTRSSPPTVPTAPSASTGSSARCSSSTAPRRPSGSPWTGWPAGITRSSRPRCGRTSGT